MTASLSRHFLISSLAMSLHSVRFHLSSTVIKMDASLRPMTNSASYNSCRLSTDWIVSEDKILNASIALDCSYKVILGMDDMLAEDKRAATSRLVPSACCPTSG